MTSWGCVRMREQDQHGTSWSCSTAVYKPVWHTPLLSVQWINSWWWTDELSETYGVSYLNKFVKLVHLDGFIIKKHKYGKLVSFYVTVVGKITRSLPPCSKMVKNLELEYFLWCAGVAGDKVWLSHQWCLHPVELRRRQLQWTSVRLLHTMRRAATHRDALSVQRS